MGGGGSVFLYRRYVCCVAVYPLSGLCAPFVTALYDATSMQTITQQACSAGHSLPYVITLRVKLDFSLPAAKYQLQNNGTICLRTECPTMIQNTFRRYSPLYINYAYPSVLYRSVVQRYSDVSAK
jgi:hypothetical protein